MLLKQQRLNSGICGELLCWGTAGAPWEPATEASTEGLPVDFSFAALAGKVVLASCSRITALTCSSLVNFTFEHSMHNLHYKFRFAHFHAKAMPLKSDRNENKSPSF